MDICLNALLSDLNDDTSDGLHWIAEQRGRRLPPALNSVGEAVSRNFASDDPLYPIDAFSWQEKAIGQLRKSFFKKFEDRSKKGVSPEWDARADRLALAKFLRCNKTCRNWRLDANRSLEDDLLLGLLKQQLYRFFYPSGENRGSILSDYMSFFHKGDVGPGSSIGSEGTDFYTKICAGELTGTSRSLFSVYEHALQNIPRWNHAEKLRHSEYGDIKLVRGNRLSFVPKNVDVSRCICTEPLLNMFFQKGIEAILKKRLKDYFQVDLSTQEECNRFLAQAGSKDGFYCTIDLSSASDSMSLSMVKSIFPSDVSRWLEWARSKEVRIPNELCSMHMLSRKGGWEELHMISTMGNAFTFPLQTILFSCAVAAVYEAQEIELLIGYKDTYQVDLETGKIANTRRFPNFGVYGDDIIVTKQAYRQTVRLLNILGFSVNADKSFSEGHFRESCGGDFFDGHLVRGVYIKSLKTQAARYVAINRLNQWSAMTGISLSRTVQRLVKTVRFLPVPLAENDDAGIKVPEEMVENRKLDRDTRSVKYRKWSSIGKAITITEDALIVPGKRPNRFKNDDGLYLASLRGDIRNGKLGSRLGPSKYRTKMAITPYWDYLPPATAIEYRGYSQSRLVDAIRANLIS